MFVRIGMFISVTLAGIIFKIVNNKLRKMTQDKEMKKHVIP